MILAPEDKPRLADYDNFVSAEIPDPEATPRLYNVVTRHMIHGPCGAMNQQCPCMADGNCTKGFPKTFQEETSAPSDSYALYRRRDTPPVTITRG